MNEKRTLQDALMAPMKDKIIILWMVVQGLGNFFLFAGMVGIMFVLGPMQYIVKFQFETIFGNVALDFVLCLIICILGGAVSFIGGSLVNYKMGFYK